MARRKIDLALRVSALLLVGLTSPSSVLATPEKASSYYEDALKRYDRNDIPAAVIQLKNAIQQDSKMLAAHLLLGKALLRNGDLKGAEAAFEEALKQGVNRGEVALPLGQVYLALGRPEAVIEKISASGLSPALQVEVLTMRANAYFETGKNSLATQSLENAKAIDPKSASPLIAEVPMLLAAGRLNLAKERAGKAVELAPNNAFAWNVKASVLHASFDAPGALVAYDKALALNPNHVDARVARAALLIDLKRDSDARKDLDYLKTYAEDEPRAAYLRSVLASKSGGNVGEVAEALREVTRTIDALPPDWLARREQLLMAGALAHYGLGNYQKAREYLDALLARKPNDNGAKKLLASIYVESKDYGRAQPVLEGLQRALPEDPQVLFMLGSINMAQKRYAQASSQLERAAARTGSAEMNRTLGFSLVGAGQVDKGMQSLEKAFTANPNDTKSGMALATIYMRSGKPDKALKLVDTMVKRDPANLTALNFLGTLKGATGDKSGARATYQRVLEKESGFVPSVLNLVRLDVSDKRFDEGRRHLDSLLKQNSNDYQVLYEYGQLEQRAGRNTEAERYLTKAGEVQRLDPGPSLTLIELYFAQRQNDKALSVAKDLAGKFSSSLRVQLTLALAHIANGDLINARTILAAATRMAEFDTRQQVAIARLQLSAANPDGASYSVYKALQGTPDDISALALAVQVEARKGNPAKADEALKVLTGKYPNASDTQRATADLAMSRKQYAVAATMYRKLLLQQESTANAFLLINALIASGDSVKAISIIEEWLKKHPEEAGMRKALADTLYQTGRLADAKHAYQRLLSMSPNDAISLNNYANLLQQLNDPSAEEFAAKALSISPENSAYSDTLGWILLGKGQTDKALRYLREARLRNPESATIRFHLASALARSGRKDEARSELEAALAGGLPRTYSDQAQRLKLELK